MHASIITSCELDSNHIGAWDLLSWDEQRMLEGCAADSCAGFTSLLLLHFWSIFLGCGRNSSWSDNAMSFA